MKCKNGLQCVKEDNICLHVLSNPCRDGSMAGEQFCRGMYGLHYPLCLFFSFSVEKTLLFYKFVINNKLIAIQFTKYLTVDDRSVNIEYLKHLRFTDDRTAYPRTLFTKWSNICSDVYKKSTNARLEVMYVNITKLFGRMLKKDIDLR